MFEGRIFVCADIHGDVNVVRDIIEQIDNPTKEDTIIVCGDAGFEYQDYVMGHAKRAARKFPGVWIVLRGNHDSCYWKEHTLKEADSGVDGWKILRNNGDDFLYQNRFKNILYVRDEGGIYKIGPYNFLMLPGAYSIDKHYRLKNGLPWNPDEQLDLDTMSEILDITYDWNENGFPIDYVIGHTFPKYLEPRYKDLFISFIDQNTVDKTTENWLDAMADVFEYNSDFKHYFGGHFHDDRALTHKYTMVYHKIIRIK